MEKETVQARFLIVEPDLADRERLRALVEGQFGTAQAVGTLKEALSVLDTGPVNIVISAWNLPGAGSGFSLLKLIREEKRFEKVAFILISTVSSEEPEKVRGARASQVDGYLLKPINDEVLTKLLVEILSKPR